jgi:hypothetical protein
MTLALSSPTILSNLIVSDIAPTRTSLSSSFIRYLKAMTAIGDPASGARTRQEAGKILEGVEKVRPLIVLLFFLKHYQSIVGPGSPPIPSDKLTPSFCFQNTFQDSQIPDSYPDSYRSHSCTWFISLYSG